MTPKRSFQWTVVTFGIVTLVGIGICIWGQTLSVYRVPFDETVAAFQQWCTGEPAVDPIAGERYLAMFGVRYWWIDLGLGLACTALTGLILATFLYGRATDERWLLTPSRRWHFLAAGWATIGWTLVASYFSLMEDFERRLFPWCADSLGIPLAGLIVFSVILFIACTIIGLLLLTGFGTLPAPLDQWDRRRPLRSWLVSLTFATLITLVAAEMVIDAQTSMSIGNPAGLIAIYLLASTRAALLAPKVCGE